MAEPQFITDDILENKGFNSELLFEEGLKIIQQLTGGFWTDYNAHDPGITILEYLCDAIVELNSRADAAIEDHLYNKATDKKIFYESSEILSCNSLTISDYRKLILDELPEVKNIWFFPTDPLENSLNGLYKVYVDIHDELETEEVQQRITVQIKDIFCANRNICEDIDEVVIVDTLPIHIQGDIEVRRMDEVENILAHILFDLNEYFNPTVSFYSLKEMVEKGYSLDEIYNGPLLKHGFIRQEELIPKTERILISEVIKIIMQIDGVSSVKDLYLQIDGKTHDNQIEVGKTLIPVLVFDTNLEQGGNSINFYKGDVVYNSLDLMLTKRKYNELESAHKRVYRQNEEKVEVPEGRPLDIQSYSSLQYLFPEVYGIGVQGVPNGGGELRKAQAKQLKGFLLLFEQLLSNHLAQLAHVKDLFSTTNGIQQTYFHQNLDVVPDVEPLYRESEGDFIDNGVDGETKIPLNYKQGLPKLVQARDNFIDRRNRILDFLLAIHGEDYMRYATSQKNYYFRTKDYQNYLIKNKSRFFEHLVKMNQHRSKAYDYRKELIGTENVPGLETKINILLGFGFTPESKHHELPKKHPLLKPFDDRKLQLLDNTAPNRLKRQWTNETNIDQVGLNEAIIEENYDYIDTSDITLAEKTVEYRQQLLEKAVFMRTKIIDSTFLVHGLKLKNYQVGEHPINNEKYCTVFVKPDSPQPLLIGEYDNIEDATNNVQVVVDYLRNLNIQSEGFYLFEHILLRPDVEDKKFGIYLTDENGDNFLRSFERYEFKERITKVKELEPHLNVYEHYSVERRDDGDFEIHFHTADKSMQFVSLKTYESVQEIHEKMERVYKFLANKEDIRSYEEKIAFYIQNSDDDDLVPESFFAYQATLLLPSWTARFSDLEFRSMFRDTVNECKPANVKTQLMWLDIDQMKTYEALYYKWTDARRNDNNKAENDILNNQMTQLLLELASKK
ncbi:hypothetical protein [uncultured Microscilla sp.]|uniref:hypothetical protein n=1 Tax=uncultured Microscilla sp. TaxID=432653 RepID=UPI002619F8ED|nr:hypothetical protein [uncultured Microscilla sp.]